MNNKIGKGGKLLIINDLLSRHGIYKNSHYHIIETNKLKKYFDDMLGHNLYDLFPEIKNNL